MSTGETFTLEDLMSLSVQERIAIATEIDLSEEDRAKAVALPDDPDLQEVIDPDLPAKEAEPAPAAEALPDAKPVPLTPIETAPVAAPVQAAETIDQINARIEAAQAAQDALIARYEDLEITPEQFKAQNRELTTALAQSVAQRMNAEQAETLAAQTQQVSDEAWFRDVVNAMTTHGIAPGTDRAQGFDVVLRRYEETRSDLTDADKIAASVAALSTIEAAGIDGRHFAGFNAVLSNIEAARRDMPEADKISLALTAYAAVAQAAGTPIRLPTRTIDLQLAPPVRLQNRPEPLRTLANLPNSGLPGPSNPSRVADITAAGISGAISALEEERAVAAISDEQWDREARAQPGNNAY